MMRYRIVRVGGDIIVLASDRKVLKFAKVSGAAKFASVAKHLNARDLKNERHQIRRTRLRVVKRRPD